MKKNSVKGVRSNRRHHNERIIKKRMKQCEALGVDKKKNHRMAKTHPFTCGDSNCAMCGNPRKFYNEPTIQERRAFQEEE